MQLQTSLKLGAGRFLGLLAPTPDRSAAPAAAARAFCPRWAAALALLVALIDLVWLAATPLSLDLASVAPAANGLLFGAALLILARWIELPARLDTLLTGTGLLLLVWPALRLFNHLAMSTAFPLADARLAGWDARLGFDWLGYALWLDGQPWLLRPMSWAYGGLTFYSCLTFALLAMFDRIRAREYFLLFLMSSIAASTIGMFFPAVAAMAHYAPDPGLFSMLSEATGTYHLHALAQLRTDPSHAIALTAMPGLTTFPSFHTAMGLIGIYCGRSTARLLVPLLLVNGLMIASTPVLGSHYLVDVLAGGLLTLGAIVALRAIDRAAGPA
jgi:membrane-associated phospholipid phosphatase